MSTATVPTTFFNNVPKEKCENPKALKTQLEVILDILKDGLKHTVSEVRLLTGFNENSIQAQFRNARKLGYNVDGRRWEDGIFYYQLLPSLTGVTATNDTKQS